MNKSVGNTITGVLFASNEPAIQADSCLTDSGYHVDIRVYWHGNVTTWLDKVIVEDDSRMPMVLRAVDKSFDRFILIEHGERSYVLWHE